ncbi:MAG: RNA polymerase sigma factor [Flavobacteriales bacterium]|nr:RNA polymerase sigma factor [Flavobacteriales bacterium]
MKLDAQDERIKEHLAKSDFKTAFEIILSEFKQPLYWHIRNMLLSHDDTDDILQETFIKIWKNLPRFEQRSKVYSWAYRIATNESLGFIDKRKRKHAESLDDNQHLENTMFAEEYFDGDEAHKTLLAAVQTLPQKQQMIFNMKYFQEMKYDEISEITETSVGALKASYHHAVRKIEDFVKIKSD